MRLSAIAAGGAQAWLWGRRDGLASDLAPQGGSAVDPVPIVGRTRTASSVGRAGVLLHERAAAGMKCVEVAGDRQLEVDSSEQAPSRRSASRKPPRTRKASPRVLFGPRCLRTLVPARGAAGSRRRRGGRRGPLPRNPAPSTSPSSAGSGRVRGGGRGGAHVAARADCARRVEQRACTSRRRTTPRAFAARGAARERGGRRIGAAPHRHDTRAYRSTAARTRVFSPGSHATKPYQSPTGSFSI